MHDEYLDTINVHETDVVTVELNPIGSFQPVKNIVRVNQSSPHVSPESNIEHLVWNLEFTSTAGEDIRDGDDAMRIVNCAICMSRQRNALLLPCRHVLCCTECAFRIKNCPICRKPVSERVPVMLSRAEMPLIGERMIRSEVHSMRIAHVRKI